MRTSTGSWVAGVALAASITMQPATAAPVAIDDLYIGSAALSISLSTPPLGPVLNTGTIPIAPAVWIDMGVYQDPIVSGSGGGVTWKIYSAGPNPPPSGTVDAATNSIDVDLSSLRLNVTGLPAPLPDPFDEPLWPVILPADAGTYNPLGDSWSLTWSKDFSVWVEDLGTTVAGTVDLTLGGTLTTVPVPAAVWLFGSGLLGLAGVARRSKAA